MKIASALVVLALASTVFGDDHKETMCVKQKDGMYKCMASGKIQKEPCCDTPSNSPTPKPKKNSSANCTTT
jgi:hypothetical protein